MVFHGAHGAECRTRFCHRRKADQIRQVEFLFLGGGQSLPRDEKACAGQALRGVPVRDTFNSDQIRALQRQAELPRASLIGKRAISGDGGRVGGEGIQAQKPAHAMRPAELPHHNALADHLP